MANGKNYKRLTEMNLIFLKEYVMRQIENSVKANGYVRNVANWAKWGAAAMSLLIPALSHGQANLSSGPRKMIWSGVGVQQPGIRFGDNPNYPGMVGALAQDLGFGQLGGSGRFVARSGQVESGGLGSRLGAFGKAGAGGAVNGAFGGAGYGGGEVAQEQVPRSFNGISDKQLAEVIYQCSVEHIYKPLFNIRFAAEYGSVEAEDLPSSGHTTSSKQDLEVIIRKTVIEHSDKINLSVEAGIQPKEFNLSAKKGSIRIAIGESGVTFSNEENGLRSFYDGFPDFNFVDASNTEPGQRTEALVAKMFEISFTSLANPTIDPQDAKLINESETVFLNGVAVSLPANVVRVARPFNGSSKTVYLTSNMVLDLVPLKACIEDGLSK